MSREVSARAAALMAAAAAIDPPGSFTHPSVFIEGIEDGWAELEVDPTQIDWATRQAAAAVWFDVVNGRPVNPFAKTGITHGRNEFGLWGENLMADSLITLAFAGHRYILLVERGDGYGWAAPGGGVEPGETGLEAALRELREETRYAGDPPTFRVKPPEYVPDPRGSDEAWAVTVAVWIELGLVAELPAVRGGDDARRAVWVRADSYDDLVATLRCEYDGRVFSAHVEMLRDRLAGC